MESLAVLIPRLWPFLSHNSSLVRKSTLSTIKTLTSPVKREEDASTIADGAEETYNMDINTHESTAGQSSGDGKSLKLIFGVSDWPKQLLQDALRHIYQRILCEPKQEIQQLAQDVWENLVIHADLCSLLHAACPYMSGWMCLAMQPTRLPFESNVLIQIANNGSVQVSISYVYLIQIIEIILNLN